MHIALQVIDKLCHISCLIGGYIDYGYCNPKEQEQKKPVTDEDLNEFFYSFHYLK